MRDFESPRPGLALGGAVDVNIGSTAGVNRGCFRFRRSAGNRAGHVFTVGFPAKSRFSQETSRIAAGTPKTNVMTPGP